MSLQTVVTSLDTGQSLSDLTAAVKAYEETVNVMAPAGMLLAYFAGINKLSVLETISEDGSHALQDAAKAAMIAMTTKLGFDFSLAETSALLASFVSASVLTQAEADAITAMGQSTSKPYANAKEFEVKRVRA